MDSANSYRNLPGFDPWSVDDLLRAHFMVTEGLIGESGRFRSRNVYVVDGWGNVLHTGAAPGKVPGLVQELLGWASDADLRPMEKTAYVHFGIENIHPFADGNGRTGRLWHSLILSKWNGLFTRVPLEPVIHRTLASYCRALNTAVREGDATNFLEYMTTTTLQAVEDYVKKENFPVFTTHHQPEWFEGRMRKGTEEGN